MTGSVDANDIGTVALIVAISIAIGVLVRLVLGWLAEHTARTRWSGDEVVVGLLRDFALYVAVIVGGWGAAISLPLRVTVRHRVDQLLVVALIVLGTLLLARLVSGLIRSAALERTGIAPSASIFVNIARIVIFAIGFLVVLQSLGVSITPMLTALGVGGLAVALALQDTLANLFAGIHILASKKVQPGDFVQLDSGENGYIVDINWRNTTIQQLPNNIVIVPNAKLAGAILTNYYQPEQEMSVLVQVGVSYGSDLNQVERVTIEVAGDVMQDVEGGVPEHEPFIRYHTFGDSSINFSVILRVQEFTAKYLVTHEFVKRLHARYQREGIEIPFPIRTVVMAEGTGTDDSRSRPTLPVSRNSTDG